VFVLVLAVGCAKKEGKPQENSTTKEAASQKVEASDFPSMQITLLDGKLMNAKELKGKTVLVLFQPDCDHCQHEAEDIEDHLASFRDYTLYFVSSAGPEEIRKFSNTYKLSGIPNIIFGATTVESILNNFGAIQAPSIYIYSEEGKLVNSFNGQTDVGVILKYL
jgi:peroxiredoxin